MGMRNWRISAEFLPHWSSLKHEPELVERDWRGMPTGRGGGMNGTWTRQRQRQAARRMAKDRRTMNARHR